MFEFDSVYNDEIAQEQAIIDRLATVEPAPESVQNASRKLGGRPTKVEPIKLVAWRQAHNASIPETAKRWNVSPATVKRMCRDYGAAAKLERQRWEHERLDEELRQHEYAHSMMFLGHRNKHLSWISFQWFSACEAAKGTPQEASVEAARKAALAEAERDFREDWERCMGPIPENARGR